MTYNVFSGTLNLTQLNSHVTAILVFSDVLNFIEAVCSIYQNIQYFIRSKNCVLNFTADRYSLHKCRETMLC